MNLIEFRDTLKILVLLNNNTVDLQVDGIQTPKNFFLIQSIKAQIGFNNYIEYEVEESGLEFSFYNKNNYKFLIKKEDENVEDLMVAKTQMAEKSIGNE